MSTALIAAAADLAGLQAAQDVAVGKDVAGLMRALGQAPAARMHELLPVVIEQHAQASSLIAAHWYENLDPGSKFRAKPHPDIPAEQIAKSIDWALYAPGDEPPQSRLTGASQRLVRGATRKTIVANATKEQVRYARYAKPDACAFCRVLAMRGSGRRDQKYLYDTEHAAEFRKSDGEKYHTHCFCVPVPIRAGQIWTPPDYMTGWDEQYTNASRKVRGGKDRFKRIVTQVRTDYGERPVKPEDKPDNVVQLQKQALPVDLDSADSLEAIGNFMADKHGLKVDQFVHIEQEKPLVRDGVEYGARTMDIDTGREFAQAVDDMLDKYPFLDLGEIKGAWYPVGDPLRSSAHAGGKWNLVTHSYDTAEYVAINDLTDPEDRKPGSQRRTRAVHHSLDSYDARYKESPTATERPVYTVMIHEMGHVVDFNGGTTARNLALRALRSYFSDNVWEPIPVGAMPDDQRALAFQDGERAWLAENLVSAYSFRNSDRASGVINVIEALAEAFCDVELRGEDASITSKIMHEVMIATAREKKQAEAADTGVAAIAGGASANAAAG